MAGPRLLDKKVINGQVASERRKEIETGLSLAKKVDALRRTYEEETGRLETFRKESVKRVQEEIDAKLIEREALEIGNRKLREERILAQAPIDLKEEWLKVREDQGQLTAWKDSLAEESISLLAREEDAQRFSEKLEKRDHEVILQEAASAENLREAEQKHLQAQEELEAAEKRHQESVADAQQRDNHLRVREEDATTREVSLSKRERDVDAHETDLANREIKLKANQETFAKAKAYINRKNK